MRLKIKYCPECGAWRVLPWQCSVCGGAEGAANSLTANCAHVQDSVSVWTPTQASAGTPEQRHFPTSFIVND